MPPNGTRASSRLKSVPPENDASKPRTSAKKRAMSVAAGDDKAPRKRGRPAKNLVTGEVAQNLARGSRTKAINLLQQPASHPRPPRLCFVFGTGDFGQFGLGTETLGEISRPRLHAWFETAAKGDILGTEGAGVEKICAGGMHTLAVDEAGKVRNTHYFSFMCLFSSGLVLGDQRQRGAGASHQSCAGSGQSPRDSRGRGSRNSTDGCSNPCGRELPRGGRLSWRQRECSTRARG